MRSVRAINRREQILSTASLNQLQLLWKRRLGEQALTAPAIVGRLITHHGFQELIFIANSAGDVFAIDDDLNRILWTRHLPRDAQSCGAGLTAAPVFPPLPHNAVDSDEDNPYAPRPVYVLSSDGRLYALNPMTGKDMSASAISSPQCQSFKPELPRQGYLHDDLSRMRRARSSMGARYRNCSYRLLSCAGRCHGQ